MKSTWFTLALLGIFLTTGIAIAQTTSPPRTTATATTASNAGAFDKLSPGGQKIARALFDAQQTSTPSSGTTSTASKPLSLDDIAAMKQSGQGWGQIFHNLKAQGLVQEKNLGQVVSKFSRQSAPSGTTITSGTGRTRVEGGAGFGHSGKASSGDDSPGAASGSAGSAAGGSNASGHAGGGAAHGVGRGR